MIGLAIFEDIKGHVLLTTKRVRFRPNGPDPQEQNWQLARVTTVINTTDSPGFGLKSGDEVLARFRCPSSRKGEWFEAVLDMTNSLDNKIDRAQWKKTTSPAPETPTEDEAK